MNVDGYYNIFFSLQIRYNKKMSDEIFGEGEISDHLFEKWKHCDYNIIDFISRLDSGNKQKIFNWIRVNVDF